MGAVLRRCANSVTVRLHLRSLLPLTSQGFLVAEHEINMSLDEFKAEFAPSGNVDRQKLNFFTNLRDDEDEKILVYYAEEKSVGIKGMRSFIGILEEKNIQRGILIYSEKMTSAARKVSLTRGVQKENS